MQLNQNVLPAISNHQDLKKFLLCHLTCGVLMNFQLAQLPELILLMKKEHKKVFVHSELIKGLASDEFGAIYLIQTLKVDGIISSKPKVIDVCKKRGVIGIFRFFLKDSISLKKSLEIARKLSPEFIEILPASSLEVIKDIKKMTSAQILMGGLIKDKQQINECLKAGAIAVTTSNYNLW